MSVTPEFAKVLEQLRDTSQPFPPKALYQLSDLPEAHLAALEAAWPNLAADRRQNVLEDLEELSEVNFEVSFEMVFRLGLEDQAAPVRAASIRGLWESDDLKFLTRLLHLMQHDPAVEVRAAAASALGNFVYLGELEEIPTAQTRRVEEALLAVFQGHDDLEVRRRALEAVSFSCRPEVTPLIEAAYAAPEEKLRVSAIFAMGRSADARWEPQVYAALESVAPEIRFEASRAAGELELEAAVPALAQMAEEGDRPVREAALWSLSQVGGPEARVALEHLLHEAEDEDKDFIREALENLILTDDLHAFPLFNFEAPDTPDTDES